LPPFLRHVLQKIEADGVFQISRVEVHDIIRPPGRNLIENVLGQIAVGVDDPHTTA